MAEPFATLNDVITLFRPLTAEEAERAEALLPLISDMLRTKAAALGADLDTRAAAESTYASTLKVVTVDICGRVLRQSMKGEPMTQESQTALGYNWQGTYAIPGGGVAGAIMRTDLKALGLRVQQVRPLEFTGTQYTSGGTDA